MTYGTDAEAAAAAFRFLVTAGPPPNAAGELILQLREQTIGSTINLIESLRSADEPLPDQAPPGGATEVADVWDSGPKLLVRILHQLPRLELDRRRLSPLDLLDAGDASPVPQVQAWATAARMTTLAGHELQRDPGQEWRIDHGAAWSVIADAAAATEALLVVDDQLDAAGLLEGLEHHANAEPRRTQRLEAAGVASTANWMSSERGWVADRASSATTTHRTPEGVLMVRAPADLAPIMRATAQVVATYTRRGVWGEERLRTAPAAALARRHLAVSQELATAAGGARGAEEVRDYFAAAAGRWATLAQYLQPLRDLSPAAGPGATEQLLLHQQTETARQVRVLAERGQLRSLDADGWNQLASESHVLFTVTARAIRRTVSPSGPALVAYRPELPFTANVNAPRPDFKPHVFTSKSRMVRALGAVISAEPPARDELGRSVREGLIVELRRAPSHGPVKRPTPGPIDGDRSRDDWSTRRPHSRGPRA